MTHWTTIACLAGTLLSASPAAGKAGFAVRPAVSVAGGKVTVTFEAGAPTDCAVSILDARGRVVRHLTAGVLGANAPAPLRKKSLTQSLVWDGTDDRGKAAAGGPFKARVCLGLEPVLDRFIGHRPGALGPDKRLGAAGQGVRALATGPKGELYVIHHIGELHGGEATTVCTAFSREGKYLRTILPFPANVPEQRLRGLRRLKMPDGRIVPFIYQADVRSLVPGAGHVPPHRAVATKDGRVAFVGIQEWLRVILRYAKPGIAQVVVLNADGSIPSGGPLGPMISQLSTSKWPNRGCEDRISRSGASLAVSPDGKTVYATGYWEGDGRRFKSQHTHVVYSFGWDDKEAKVFVGKKGKAGSGNKLLNTPMSVAADKDGNVYVADRGNDRVAVFKPDGTFLGAMPAIRPDRVEVHPRTGEVYVLGGPTINSLQKFQSWKASDPVAAFALPCGPFSRKKTDPDRTAPVMALDASSDPPVLWFTPPARGASRYSLLRLEDKGIAFDNMVDIGGLTTQGRPGVGAVVDLTLDRSRERLYAGWRKVKTYAVTAWDGRTGKLLEGVKIPRLRGGTGDVAVVGLDGNYYTVNGSKGWRRPIVSRFDRDLNPLPWPQDRDVLAGNAHVHHRGLTADHNGRLYVLRDMRLPGHERTPTEHAMANSLAVFGPDGAVVNPRLIDSEIRMLNSVRVDYAGNIYLAVGVRPANKEVPDDFAGLDLGRKPQVQTNASEMNWYPFLYGCIMKFGPEGGTIRSGVGGDAVRYGAGKTTEVTGAKWIYFGASPVPSWRTGPPYDFPDTCLCERPWFDVDGFGRSFFPDAGRFRVGVLDASGNLICTLGSYGNPDSAGPTSAVPTPEIPLCWPQAVAVGDEAVYVGDRLNRRIVRVRLAYQAEHLCDIPEGR